jgi:asparagine synthase (glutamine-hydrolysing)
LNTTGIVTVGVLNVAGVITQRSIHMTAIAGIQSPNRQETVRKMLGKMSHRGNDWQKIIENNGAILGSEGTKTQKRSAQKIQKEQTAMEFVSRSHYAAAKMTKNGLELTRDALGLSPLYYGKTSDGALCFASEVKGLLEATRDVHELLPGHSLSGMKLQRNFKLRNNGKRKESADSIARELRKKIEASVVNRITDGSAGSWLSGGIDSTALAAVAKPHVKEFHTFTAGLEGSPDVQFANVAAKHIGSVQHTRIVSTEELLETIPDVIYHLESFDALLIRSTILNYLVAKLASDFVPAVLSGEGGDELFGGYAYLKDIPREELQDELIDITDRLHNTALQRVDRSSSAHGTVAYVGFLDQDIVDLSLEIPAEYKIRDGVEKWILRKAVEDLLPEELLMRRKAKFWQGGGVQEILSDYAENQVSDNDFASQRKLNNGEILNTKEELMYYRIFKEQFGEFEDLSWMGRTKGAPVS